MLEFIAGHVVEILVVLVIAVAIAILIYKNRKDVLVKAALYIVAKVEEEWGSNMGRVKFAEAYAYLKSNYPIITFLLPEIVLSQLIEEALVVLKQILASKQSIEKRQEEVVEEITQEVKAAEE